MNTRFLTFGVLMSAAHFCTAQDEPLRCGFPRSCFNESTSIDPEIAIGVFAERTGATKSRTERGQVFETDQELLESIKLGKIDLFAMNPDVYLDSLSDIEITPILAAVPDSSPIERLLLIARKPQMLSDLKGSRLIIDNSGRGSTPQRWITYYLRNAGRDETAAEFFDSVEEVRTESRALLPVYFGKKDAAILSKNDYDAMCALNPQLHDRLHIVGRSNPVASTIICLRRGSRFHASDLILAGEKLLENPNGRQLLKLLGATKLVAFKEEYLLFDREIHNRTTPAKGRKREGGGN